MMSEPPTDLQLPAPIVPAERLLTAAEFHRLADVPPEFEWFANIRNVHTRRAYENAIDDFMGFAGIVRPEEFRTVTRAHVIAWRDDLERRQLGGATLRHRLAVVAVRISVRKERRQPQPGQRRQAPEGRKRRRQNTGARRSSGTRAAHRPRRGDHQGEA